MKLIKLELLSTFRGLQAGFEIEFNNEKNEGLIPKCIVGMNGNGKSNFIELICEIFYSLELMHLNYTPDIYVEEFYDELKDVSYGITYSVVSYKEEQEKIVFVKKEVDKSPIFYLIDDEGNKTKVTDRNFRKQLLPNKIIGYSSGQNELISVPFTRMKYNYFSEFQQNIEEGNDYEIEHSRLFYMDNETNALILLSNYLLGDEKDLDEINKEILIDKLQSFRIRLHLLDNLGEDIILDSQLNSIIEKLILCSTCFNDELQLDSRTLVIDYFVDEAVIYAFKENFGTPDELFKNLYMLYSLNIFSIPKLQQVKLRKSVQATEFSGALSGIGSSDLVFSIEDILMLKRNCSVPIHYSSFSDGEHQLMQTVGSVVLNNNKNVLFLFDEPETHFNPDWRSKFISLIDRATFKSNVCINQELILTTHSPFILSDSLPYNIYKFERECEKIVVSSPEFNTYGSSIGVILNEIFDQKSTVSFKSNSALKRYLKEEIQNLSVDEINKLRREVLQYGESSEKFEALSWLSHLRELKADQ